MTEEQALTQQEELDELRHRVFHDKKMREEREISDKRYAIKLVEVVVWGLVAAILMGVVTAWIGLVIVK